MIATDAAGAPPDARGYYLPPLPAPVTHRWIADTQEVDGHFVSWADAAKGVTVVRGSVGNTTNQPVAGQVDGYRAVTFDGNDAMFVNLGGAFDIASATQLSMHAVVKVPVLQNADKQFIDWGQHLGINVPNRLVLAATSGGAIVAPTVLTAGQWVVVAASLDRTAGVGRIATSLDPAGVEGTGRTFSAPSRFYLGGQSAPAAKVAREFAFTPGVCHSLAELTAQVAYLAEFHEV